MVLDISERIPVLEETLAQLMALYRSGYLPDSPGLQDQAATLGWTACAHLDERFAKNPLASIILPDDRVLSYNDIIDRIDWSRPRAVRVGDLFIAPRRNFLIWWYERPFL